VGVDDAAHPRCFELSRKTIEMPAHNRDEHRADVTDSTEADSRDPRDTDHPTGSKQAVENAANESPS